ncbi:hypothetical protein J6S37_02185 [Candidatus Saccharibacteria bacterium]|nr:hypothetical protein [Candidatus Saccharibacteria bacterium]
MKIIPKRIIVTEGSKKVDLSDTPFEALARSSEKKLRVVAEIVTDGDKPDVLSLPFELELTNRLIYDKKGIFRKQHDNILFAFGAEEIEPILDAIKNGAASVKVKAQLTIDGGGFPAVFDFYQHTVDVVVEVDGEQNTIYLITREGSSAKMKLVQKSASDKYYIATICDDKIDAE